MTPLFTRVPYHWTGFSFQGKIKGQGRYENKACSRGRLIDREIERETETERQRERQRERQTDRQTDRPRQTDRKTETETERDTERKKKGGGGR